MPARKPPSPFRCFLRKRGARMRAFTHQRWRVDEVYVRINGVQH